MRRDLAALISGLLFGAGILLSGMSNPAKVLGFLDIAGHWDPSLAFVIAGGVLVTAIGYRLVFATGRPLYEPVFDLPRRTEIDAPLIAGAATFGIGWGLAGFCPGSVLPVLASLSPEPWLFFAALLAGIIAGRVARSRPTAPPAGAGPAPGVA